MKRDQSSMKREQEEGIHRRRVIEAGVAGAALLVLPEGCSSSTGDGQGDASSMDATKSKDATTKMDSPMQMDTGGPCKTDFVDAGGGCKQSDQTAAINIVKAGLDQPGTSYEFSDCRFMDLQCEESQIILIHPVTKMGYVALSGACPHLCCDKTGGGGGPTYMPSCKLSLDEDITGGFACNAPSDAGASDGGPDADASDGGLDASGEAGADGATDAGTDATSDAGPGLHAGQVLTDVLYCTCHGSMFDALTGEVINGPAAVGLDKLETCDADGWIFVTIPKSST